MHKVTKTQTLWEVETTADETQKAISVQRKWGDANLFNAADEFMGEVLKVKELSGPRIDPKMRKPYTEVCPLYHCRLHLIHFLLPVFIAQILNSIL